MKIWNISILVFLSRAPSRHVTTPLLYDFMKVGQNLGNIQIRNILALPCNFVSQRQVGGCCCKEDTGTGAEVHVCFVSSLSLSHIVFVLCRNILLFIVCWERRIAATHHFALSSDWNLWSRVGPHGFHTVSQCRLSFIAILVDWLLVR